MTTTDLALGTLGQVSVHAHDIDRAEAFYRDTLGLPHLYTFGQLAFFDAGGVRLYIQAVAEDSWRDSSVLYFEVDDIGRAFGALSERGVKTTGAPHLIHRHADTGIEEWMAFFEDSEGNTLALMAKILPATAG